MASQLHAAAIALGSNLPSAFGSPEDNLHEAIKRIGSLGEVTAVSSVHQTAPVGFIDQPHFSNAALLLSTYLSAQDLMHALLTIEEAMGRLRVGVPQKGPRTIDLDLILYDNLVLATPELTLPHPAMRERAFVLAPLAEIAADSLDPLTGLTIRQLLARQQKP